MAGAEGRCETRQSDRALHCAGKNDFGKAVSRILSVPTSRERESFVSAASTRNPSAFAEMRRAAARSPIWPCTRWGFPCLVACASSGALLPHLFTLAALIAPYGGLFSVALSVEEPLDSPPACISGQTGLRGIAPSGVRTFLRPLARPAILRLPKIGAKVAGNCGTGK